MVLKHQPAFRAESALRIGRGDDGLLGRAGRDLQLGGSAKLARVCDGAKELGAKLEVARATLHEVPDVELVREGREAYLWAVEWDRLVLSGTAGWGAWRRRRMSISLLLVGRAVLVLVRIIGV